MSMAMLCFGISVAQSQHWDCVMDTPRNCLRLCLRGYFEFCSHGAAAGKEIEGLFL